MNSILVIQLKRLGDVILTTPALSGLRKLYPEAHVTLLLDHHSAALAPAIGDVNEVWIYQRNESFNLWFNLVRRKFDLCLDFTGNDRSALISFLSKAAQRIGFSFVAKRAARSWVYTHLVQSPVREKHTADHYLDLIRSPGRPVLESALSLHLPEGVERSAEKLRREIGVTGPYVFFTLARRGLRSIGWPTAGPRSSGIRKSVSDVLAWSPVGASRRNCGISATFSLISETPPGFLTWPVRSIFC